MTRLGLGLQPAQVQQQIGQFGTAARLGQVVKQVGEEVAVVRAAGPAVRALRLVGGQQLLVRGRGDGSRTLDVVVDQVVQRDMPPGCLAGAGCLRHELHERPLPQRDEQLLRFPVVELAGMGPERGDGGLGGRLVRREDRQLQEPLPLVGGKELDAHVDGVPDALVVRLHGVPVGDPVDPRLLELLEHAAPRQAPPDHAAAQRHRERQPAALGDDGAGFARQFLARDSGGQGQHVQGFVVGQQLDHVMHAAQRREQAGVAGGDQRAATGAEHVEPVDIGPPPDVVEDKQDGLVGEQLLEPGLALVFGLEGTVAPQVRDARGAGGPARRATTPGRPRRRRRETPRESCGRAPGPRRAPTCRCRPCRGPPRGPPRRR